MNPLRRYPVLASLLSPFRRSQQKTCAAVVAALCQAAQPSSFAIAGQLSSLTEGCIGSGNDVRRRIKKTRVRLTQTLHPCILNLMADTEHGPHLFRASPSAIGILLRRRYWQPSL
jgi:hypothetical protein